MSAMQKLVLEQDAKRHVPMVSTHFYQVDPKEGKLYLCIIQPHGVMVVCSMLQVFVLLQEQTLFHLKKFVVSCEPRCKMM